MVCKKSYTKKSLIKKKGPLGKIFGANDQEYLITEEEIRLEIDQWISTHFKAPRMGYSIHPMFNEQNQKRNSV